MKYWRSVLVATLLLIPVLVITGIGTWALWQAGWLRWCWWILPVCWGLAYLLAKRWQDKLLDVPATQLEPPLHWTPQDKQAIELVEALQQKVTDIPPSQLSDPQFYLDTARDVSLQIAQHYHPKAKDPLGSLSVPEILAASQLALEDVSQWVHDYVPGSHMLSVNQWRQLAKAPAWLKTAGDLTWAVSVFWNPANLGRFLSSRLAMGSATKELQANLLAAFYMMFVRRVGFYAVEMNSGRLRGGASQYRQAMAKLEQPRSPAEASAVDESSVASQNASEPLEVTICLVGQVNAGKSSLINGLLGQRQAVTDILPETSSVQRYQLTLPGVADRLVLLDTPGYGAQGASKAQLRETQAALQQSDLVLLVLDATSPAREPDVQHLQRMRDRFESQRHLKPPPLVAVLTHIDGLSPVMQWSPPYDWESPTEPKEKSIAGAVEYNRQQLAPAVSGVVPVCTDLERDRLYGVHQWLVPVIVALLDEARSCALLQALHEELDRGQIRKVVSQCASAGAMLLKTYVLGGVEDLGKPAGQRLNDE